MIFICILIDAIMALIESLIAWFVFSLFGLEVTFKTIFVVLLLANMFFVKHD